VTRSLGAAVAAKPTRNPAICATEWYDTKICVDVGATAARVWLTHIRMCHNVNDDVVRVATTGSFQFQIFQRDEHKCDGAHRQESHTPSSEPGRYLHTNLTRW